MTSQTLQKICQKTLYTAWRRFSPKSPKQDVDIALPQGERALDSPDVGEHDNGSGKSKAAHDGHKSLAFNLQQPRNPQPEAVCLACQSAPRRAFHRRSAAATEQAEPD